jgi:hypothetical protein
MADQSLQAFQLGANLFDRAQTQARMMEQFQQQTAESLLQRQGMELQNKIRDAELASAIGERQAQVEEYKTFSDLSKQVGDFLDNPTENAKFPVIPAFKSKTYRAEADKMLNNLEKYSARAKLLKATSRAEAQADSIAASTLNEAIKFGAIEKDADGKININIPLLNQRSYQFKQAEEAKVKAQSTSLLTNLELSRDRLNALIANNASDADIAKARLAVEKSFKEARVKLDEEELGFKKSSTATKLGIDQQKVDVAKNNLDRLIKEGADKNAIAEATLNYKKAIAEKTASLNREKFDFGKGVQLKKLELQELDLGQRVKRTDAYIQNLLKPVAEKDVKLNTFDDGVVRKTASFVANQQSAADSIERTMEILDDPNVDQSVKIRSAQLLAKDLNDPKGRDAVGNQEADRILGELDIISFSRAWDKGDVSAFLGRDLSGFREKLELTKNGLDSKISKSVDRINSIYKKYEGGAGTPQTPSRGAMIMGGTPQATSRTNAPAMPSVMSQTNAPSMSPTNAPAMSGTNSVSDISFKSIAEALSKGKKPGDSVIINGVPGKLK